MNYKEILIQIAEKHNTNVEEVEAEMQKALSLAGLDVAPQFFISCAKAKVEKTIYRN